MSDTATIRLSFTYQPEDYRRIVKRSGVVPVSSWKMMIWTIFLTFVLFEVTYFCDKIVMNRPVALAAQPRMPVWSYWLITFLMIATALSTYITFTLLFGRNRKFLATSRESAQDVEISSRGVRWSTDSCSTEYQWKYFNTYGESKTTLDLFGPGSVILILPKRAMLPEDIERARKLFLENIEPAAIKSPGG